MRGLLTRLQAFGIKAPVVGVVAVGVSLLTLGAVGASPSGLPNLAEVAGLTHGAAVSNAVEDAKGSLEEGEKTGPAVSEAACTAAHDRTTLPEGAQNAPGQADREPKDCTHPSNADDESADTDESAIEPADEPEADGEEAENHGQSVSQAVKDAKSGLEDGEKVGPAVSEAACTAAHDRTTLPEGAQNAPGQEGREPKDCTHPSNQEGETEAVSDAGSSKPGKGTAPGQLKKASD